MTNLPVVVGGCVVVVICGVVVVVGSVVGLDVGSDGTG